MQHVYFIIIIVIIIIASQGDIISPRFSSDTDIQADVLSWLEVQDPNVYMIGISTLPPKLQTA